MTTKAVANSLRPKEEKGDVGTCVHRTVTFIFLYTNQVYMYLFRTQARESVLYWILECNYTYRILHVHIHIKRPWAIFLMEALLEEVDLCCIVHYSATIPINALHQCKSVITLKPPVAFARCCKNIITLTLTHASRSSGV